MPSRSPSDLPKRHVLPRPPADYIHCPSKPASYLLAMMQQQRQGGRERAAPARTAASASGRACSRVRRCARVSSSALREPRARTDVFHCASPVWPSNSDTSPMNCPGPRVVTTTRSDPHALRSRQQLISLCSYVCRPWLPRLCTMTSSLVQSITL